MSKKKDVYVVGYEDEGYDRPDLYFFIFRCPYRRGVLYHVSTWLCRNDGGRLGEHIEFC